MSAEREEGEERRLALVGVVHRDPDGYRRLRALLARERPTHVTLELSRHAVRWRRGPGRALARAIRAAANAAAAEESVRVRRILEFLRLPFEYRAARDHARETGAAVLLLDLSRFSRPKLDTYETAVREELAALAFPQEERPFQLADLSASGGDGRGSVRSAYARARHALRDPGRHLDLADDEARRELRRRDAHVARRLEGLLAASPSATVVHVAGWEHLLAGGGRRSSLYARLRALRPRRLLLEPLPALGEGALEDDEDAEEAEEEEEEEKEEGAA
jgi:hypothetical protein